MHDIAFKIQLHSLHENFTFFRFHFIIFSKSNGKQRHTQSIQENQKEQTRRKKTETLKRKSIKKLKTYFHGKHYFESSL